MTDVYEWFQKAVKNKDLHMNKNNDSTNSNFKTHNTLTVPKSKTDMLQFAAKERRHLHRQRLWNDVWYTGEWTVGRDATQHAGYDSADWATAVPCDTDEEWQSDGGGPLAGCATTDIWHRWISYHVSYYIDSVCSVSGATHCSIGSKKV